MVQKYTPMRSNIRMLGQILGKNITEFLGAEYFDTIENIRLLSKQSNKGDNQARQDLMLKIKQLTDDEILPVARAFSHFLNLVNVAEQYYNVSPRGEVAQTPAIFIDLLNKFKHKKIAESTITNALKQLSIEIVLTAHPTEVARRSLIYKLVEINHCLQQLDHTDLAEYESSKIARRLRQLIAQCWHTEDIRRNRPSPVDEAKQGFAMIESSLWKGVTSFLRELNEQLEAPLGYCIAADAKLIRFTSWMGSDRDGNPNVTAKVTKKVLLLSQIKAVELFLKDIQILVQELSMSSCTPGLRALVGDDSVTEPYREICKKLRRQLREAHTYLSTKIAGQNAQAPDDLLTNSNQLKQPLLMCYESLISCGLGVIANGHLLDTIRRLNCFGLNLLRLDLRQESSMHERALNEITNYLGLGEYANWDEEQKQQFLIKELQSKRPLLPREWQPTDLTKEILDTCQLVSQYEQDTFACYIISMARQPSDVLAVHLLLKETGCTFNLPVCPLFETLDDLNNANDVMQQLFSIDWYRNFIDDKQMVMIGYSDSAKDAGVLAASWAQYQAQEALIQSCEKAGIELTLFHGRGGTIGRGGAPAHDALLSQPPGSLKHGLRVTEQGEMIRFKFGLPELTVDSLTRYASAILEANLLPPPQPEQQWRKLMDDISAASCAVYRQVVREDPLFLEYFRAATPEQELAKLPLGSRPAKRRPGGGIEHLRAIPWIFSWSQNRLMLPAWLGAGEGLQHAINQGQQQALEQMIEHWPFFNTRINMLEMVFSKADLWISQHYEQRLVPEQLWPLGKKLRQQLTNGTQVIKELTEKQSFEQQQPWIAESIHLRNIYTEPLNMLQVELLYRLRQQTAASPQIEQALMVSIAGIAAGMRNTG